MNNPGMAGKLVVQTKKNKFKSTFQHHSIRMTDLNNSLGHKSLQKECVQALFLSAGNTVSVGICAACSVSLCWFAFEVHFLNHVHVVMFNVVALKA